ncbi:MAG: phosphate ABC transporter permease PstA [Spirochaetota bacterium]
MSKESNGFFNNGEFKKIREKNLNTVKANNIIFKALTLIIASAIIVPLLAILIFIIYKGISVVDWQFLTTLPTGMGKKSGIANALVGTGILILIALLISVPFGIAAGIFLAEFPDRKLSHYINICVKLLQGVPSIIIGIIGYIWIVMPFDYSAIAGGIVLGVMMFPLVITSTEETLKLIPYSLRESSMALGVPYHKTIIKVILPASLSGIVTGILLGVARIAGETAPLLFTAAGSRFWNINILEPIAALPLLIYEYAKSPYEAWHTTAWGASFILVLLVFILNIITRLIIRKWKIEF